MAISNTDRGLRPGVCTSTTRPTAPYEGQMIYETDTNRVLIWDNAAWVMIADTDTPPGMVLIKTQSFTNVASTQVTLSFPTEFNSFRIVAKTNAVAGSSIYGYMYLLDNANQSTTGYVSKSLWSPMTGTSRTFDDADIRTTQFSLGPLGSSTVPTMCVFDIVDPNVATATSITGNGVGYYGSNPYSWFTSGINTNNVVYNGFEFGATTNMTGTIRVYGYRSTI